MAALAGFAAGRISQSPSAAGHLASLPGAALASDPAVATDLPERAHPAKQEWETAARRQETRLAELHDLLQRADFDDYDRLGDSCRIGLAAWIKGASEEELAAFVAHGEEWMTNKGFLRHNLLPIVFNEWASRDGDAALAMALESGLLVSNVQVMRQLFDGWIVAGGGQVAIDHAVAVQKELAPTEADFAAEVFACWFQQEPQAAGFALRAFLKSTDPVESMAGREAAQQIGAYTLRREGPDAAESWINGLPTRELRDELRLKMVELMLNGDGGMPEKTRALEMFERIENFRATDEHDSVVSIVAYLKSNQDVDAAMRWVDALPPGAAKSSAFSTVLQMTLKQKGEEAGVAWIHSRPEEAEAGSAYEALAVHAASHGNWRRALQILDDKTQGREHAVEDIRLISVWLAGSPEDASAEIMDAIRRRLAASPPPQ